MDDETLEAWQSEHGSHVPDEVYEDLAEKGYEPDGLMSLGEGTSLGDIIAKSIESGLLGEELRALAVFQFAYIDLEAIGRDWFATGVFFVSHWWWEPI